jgi:hypothetical protein
MQTNPSPVKMHDAWPDWNGKRVKDRRPPMVDDGARRGKGPSARR